MTKDQQPGDVGNTQALNRYVYAMNNPVRLIDISGLSANEGYYYQNYGSSSDSAHNVMINGRLSAADKQRLMAERAKYLSEAAYQGAWAEGLSQTIGITKIIKGSAEVGFEVVGAFATAGLISYAGVGVGFADIGSGIAELYGKQKLASVVDTVSSVVGGVNALTHIPEDIANMPNIPALTVSTINVANEFANDTISLIDNFHW